MHGDHIMLVMLSSTKQSENQPQTQSNMQHSQPPTWIQLLAQTGPLVSPVVLQKPHWLLGIPVVSYRLKFSDSN